jgi:hypothetical protein
MLETRPLKTTGVTIEDTEMENRLGKAKIYFCRRVCRHTGTASMRSRQSVLFLFLMQVGSAPLLGLVKLGFTICLQLAEI